MLMRRVSVRRKTIARRTEETLNSLSGFFGERQRAGNPLFSGRSTPNRVIDKDEEGSENGPGTALTTPSYPLTG